MYVNYISVDFNALDIQLKRLKDYWDFADEMIDRLEAILRSVSDMSLGETEIMLRIAVYAMQEISDSIRQSIIKLKKILELYDECENEITQAVNNLSFNMRSWDIPKLKYKTLDIDAYSLRDTFGTDAGTFSGHSLINDDWLNKLIYETEESR